jgi:hypothetical protein
LNFSKTTLLLVFIFSGILSQAQTITITGNVQDAHTKEPVPFASVILQASGFGKTTDSVGNFSFTLSQLKIDTLTVSYVGYQTLRIPVSNINIDTFFVLLLQRGVSSNTVFVKTKVNKGLYLWKKIMSKKKEYNRYGLDNFGYHAYNKLEIDIKNFKADKLKKNFILKPFNFVFDNIDSTSEKEPFLPAYLVESLSDYEYQSKPKKYYENIKATSTKGFKNESISKLLGVMNQNVNIYGNYINVMDKDFISPLNENGDNYYNFGVADTQIVNGNKVFHFMFSPKHAGQNTFEGDAWVLAKTFHLQKITLYLGKSANINYIDRISVFQEFEPVNDSLYFIKKDKFFADFKVLGKKSLTLIGRKTTLYKDIVVNNDSVANHLNQQKVEEVVATAANVAANNNETWDSLRFEPLSKNEAAIYTTLDKLLVMPKFQKLQNTITFIGTGYKNIGNYEIGPWFNWVSSNVWEGTRFRFDLGTNMGFNKKMYLHGYLAYGTTDKKIKGKAEAFWVISKKPNRLRLHAAYTDDIDNGISNYGEVSQDNIFSLAIRKPNITRKFIQIQDSRFEIFNEWGKGFSTEWFLIHRNYAPLQNLPPVSVFVEKTGEALQNFEVALKLRFAYLEKFIETNYFRYSLGSKYPAVDLVLAKGISGIANSSYNYTKFSASISDVMKISPLGSLSYKVYAGKINGTLPYTFLEILPGNDIYYYNKSSFNLLSRFEYLCDRYAGANVEHSIGSGLFRFLPITRKLKWRQFWAAKMMYGDLSNANKELNNSPTPFFKDLDGKVYAELGTGIDNIFKVFRLDFVWRVLPRPLPQNQSSRFGIFGSFQFQF